MELSTAARAAFLVLLLGSPAFGDGPGDHSERSKPIDTVVIHTTGLPRCEDGKAVFPKIDGGLDEWKQRIEADPRRGTHYLVDREGSYVSSVPERENTRHLELSHPELSSLAVTLLNDGDGQDPFPDAQVEGLALLLCDVLARNGLAPDALRGHDALEPNVRLGCDPEVKSFPDPGSAFPWSKLRSDTQECLDRRESEAASDE